MTKENSDGQNMRLLNEVPKIKLPDSAKLKDPFKIEGKMPDAKESFYELAKDRVRFVSHEEMLKYNKELRGQDGILANAQYLLRPIKKIDTGGDTEDFDKWITHFEILVNMDALHINGKDYSDLLPFVLEHEYYESWLGAKRGAAEDADMDKKHLLARRREYLAAEREGLGEKLLEYESFFSPVYEKEGMDALEYARKKLSREK